MKSIEQYEAAKLETYRAALSEIPNMLTTYGLGYCANPPVGLHSIDSETLNI